MRTAAAAWVVLLTACGGSGGAPDAMLSGAADASADGQVSGPDAREPDAPSPDAKLPDARLPDAKLPDARVPDATDVDAPPPPDAGLPDAPPPDAGPPDAMLPPIDLTGTVVDSYVQTLGDTQVPLDMSMADIRALAPSGDSFMSFDGSGMKDGSFTVPGVPGAGERYLRIVFPGSDLIHYYVSTAPNIDLGLTLLGRPDTVFDGTSSFSVTLSNDGPADAESWVNIYSADLGGFGLYDGQYPSDGNPLALESFPGMLVKGSDHVFISQLTSRTSGLGAPYLGLSRVFAAPSFVMKKGANVTLAAGAFSVVPDNVSLYLDWRRSQFAALAPLANPRAQVDSHQLAFLAIPASPRQSDFSAADLFLDSLDTVGDDDLNYGAIAFADPYDASWEVWSEESSYFSVDVAAPGAASDTLLAQHRQLARVADVDHVPLVPTVSPPRSPTLGGADAFLPVGNLGGTPLLAWTAPPEGADAYIVRIFGLTVDADMLTTLDLVGDLHTTSTSVRIPPDLLGAGQTFVASITAVRAPSADFEATPAATPLPYASSDLVTSRFSTDGGALVTTCDVVGLSAEDAEAIGQHYVSRVASTCKVAGFAAHTADELADLGDCVGILLRQQIGCAGVVYDGATSNRGTPCAGYLVLPADAGNVSDDDFFDLAGVLRLAIQDVDPTLLRGEVIAMLERIVDLETASVTNPASGETHSTCP